jgi:DNA-binding transcriptional ArsR family regulator
MDLITARKATCTAVFESLAAARRRRVLGILRTHHEAVPVSDVAARLVARESERSIVSVAPTDRRRIQVSLHHQHLPKLADAGLVELVADGDEVRIADHDALADDAVRTVRSLPVDDGLDPLFDALADARQRTLLSVLGLLHHPVSARRLARRVVAEERDRSPAAVPDDAVERALASLRHVHLPTLADADLLSWDPDVGRVSYRGHPLVRRRWLAESFDGALDGLATDDGTDARILSGRTSSPTGSRCASAPRTNCSWYSRRPACSRRDVSSASRTRSTALSTSRSALASPGSANSSASASRARPSGNPAGTGPSSRSTVTG